MNYQEGGTFYADRGYAGFTAVDYAAVVLLYRKTVQSVAGRGREPEYVLLYSHSRRATELDDERERDVLLDDAVGCKFPNSR